MKHHINHISFFEV